VVVKLTRSRESLLVTPCGAYVTTKTPPGIGAVGSRGLERADPTNAVANASAATPAMAADRRTIALRIGRGTAGFPAAGP
jgi:hypothetical protein